MRLPFWRVATQILETLLLPEDVASKTQLCCLSCRRRLATIHANQRAIADEQGERSLSVTLVPAEVRDFQQGQRSLGFLCSCGKRSVFHLI